MSSVRLTRDADAHLLGPIEMSAGALFRALPDLAWVADHGATPEARHRELIAAGASWVAVDERGAPVGFLAAERFGADLHIWEVAVAAASQLQGHGGRLLAACIAYARAAGLAAVTLTTFRDVAWNAPVYRAMGFCVLAGEDIGPRLAAVLRAEVADGLPGDRRCAMRLTLAP